MRIILVCFMFTILFSSCSREQEKISPSIENITESVYASGIIKTKNQYQVFSTVAGNIEKILVTENDLIKKGAPLILVSNRASKITRENALLAADYADVKSNGEKLNDLKNSIALAQSKAQNDSALFKRQQNLWTQSIGTKVDLEQKELAFENSKTTLQSARLKYADLLKQLRFNAEQSKNNLAISNTNESDFTIKSDIDGKVYFLYKQSGEMVNPQTPLALVGDSNNFLLELQVDEYDIAKIKEDQQVLITMDSYKGKVFEAKITKIYPMMNQSSKSFSVEGVFVNQPPVLYPNLTVEANIVIQSKQKALLIPRSYLINDSLVLISKNKTKAVTTGLKDYQKVEIVNGLSASDIIYKPQ
jgi:HlyD family secretion protein